MFTGALKIDREKMADSFTKHRVEGHVTLEAYEKSKKVSLAGEIQNRERIYLDLRFWLKLRDVILGRPVAEEMPRILDSLRHSVRGKERICPISDATFLELLKQQDSRTRVATAELIDELSEGVVLIPYEERMAQEVVNFMFASGGYDVVDLFQLVWSKVSYVLGITHPQTPAFSEGEMLVVQKAFFDYMWQIPLSEAEQLLGHDSTIKKDFDGIAQRLNVQNAAYSGGIKSFSQVYEDEFRGGLDLLAVPGLQAMERILAIKGETPPSLPSEGKRRQIIFNLLCAAFQNKRDLIVKALPTLEIGSLCHAAVRWDQKRQLNGNDLFDFHHAQAALPYCDVFLTEKPLHMLLSQKNVALDRKFKCRIISSFEDAAAFLIQPI